MDPVLPGTGTVAGTTMHVPVPAGVNVWQCSGMWGFGHRCAANHGHLARCRCACGEEQPLPTQCPNTPGFFHGGQFVQYPQVVTVHSGPQD